MNDDVTRRPCPLGAIGRVSRARVPRARKRAHRRRSEGYAIRYGGNTLARVIRIIGLEPGSRTGHVGKNERPAGRQPSARVCVPEFCAVRPLARA